MTTEGFEAIIEVGYETSSKEMAIATASKYLTRTGGSLFSVHSHIHQVDVYGLEPGPQVTVAIQFTMPVNSDKEREEFLSTMESEKFVQSCETKKLSCRGECSL
jgi:hypothetical protein